MEPVLEVAIISEKLNRLIYSTRGNSTCLQNSPLFLAPLYQSYITWINQAICLWFRETIYSYRSIVVTVYQRFWRNKMSESPWPWLNPDHDSKPQFQLQPGVAPSPNTHTGVQYQHYTLVCSVNTTHWCAVSTLHTIHWCVLGTLHTALVCSMNITHKTHGYEQ